MPEKTVVMADASICTVRLDRVQIVAATRGDRLPPITGFRVRKNSFVRRQTSITTYRRVQNCENLNTRSTLDIQYRPVPPWLAPVKITAIAADGKGLGRTELDTLFKAFTN